MAETNLQTAMDTLAAAEKRIATESQVRSTTEQEAKAAASSINWEEVAASVKARVLASIPSDYLIPADKKPASDQRKVENFVRDSGFFTKEEVDITHSSASQIYAKVIDRTWTAEQVIKAYSKSSAVAHQLTNCLTFTDYPRALRTAKALDEEFAKTGKPRGPLHGVPISLKDNINVKGAASTIGFVAYANAIEKEDGYLPKLLESLGAIVYVKTNVPTAMMMAETTNNLFGTTTNPLNRNLTSGGSSGGESSLIACHGAPLGVGTDIGGSIRIPAACTGLYGIRCSGHRLPMLDFRPGMAGQETILSVQGPLSHTLEDQVLYLKSVFDTKPWLQDPKLMPVPWRQEEFDNVPKKLKLGLISSDGYVNLTPPVKRALDETVEKLRAAGHEIVSWDDAPIMKCYSMLGRLFMVDGGKSIKLQIEAGNEPWPPGIKTFASAQGVSAYDLWQLHKEKAAVWKEWSDKFNESAVDGLILATAPYVAAKHGGQTHVGYTGLFNFLDYSAVNFPSGVVGDREKDVYPKDLGEPLNPLDKATREGYDAEEIHGLPVGLQIVGRRVEEEKVLGIVKRVLEAVEAK